MWFSERDIQYVEQGCRNTALILILFGVGIGVVVTTIITMLVRG